MTPKLTHRLMELDPAALRAATQHPWLRLAGQGKLSSENQLAWLKQDRLYALNYVPFIGRLVAKIEIPTTADRTSTIEWKVADTLIEALVGIKRELAMFEDLLRDHFSWGQSSNEEVQPAAPTKEYRKLFFDASEPKVSLLIGLAALWATEKCYLEAWRFAGSQQHSAQDGKGEKNPVRDILIPNWTSSDFEKFVDTIGDLVDEYSAQESVSPEQMTELEHMWRKLLEVEKDFWPSVDE